MNDTFWKIIHALQSVKNLIARMPPLVKVSVGEQHIERQYNGGAFGPPDEAKGSSPNGRVHIDLDDTQPEPDQVRFELEEAERHFVAAMSSQDDGAFRQTGTGGGR